MRRESDRGETPSPNFLSSIVPASRPFAASAPWRFNLFSSAFRLPTGKIADRTSQEAPTILETGMVGTQWGRNPFDGQSAECAYLWMRTTIELPDGLFRQVKTLAVQKGLTLKEFFTAAVERAVVEPPPESRRMLRPPIGGVEGRPIPARNNQELAALLEAEDLENLQ